MTFVATRQNKNEFSSALQLQKFILLFVLASSIELQTFVPPVLPEVRLFFCVYILFIDINIQTIRLSMTKLFSSIKAFGMHPCF